MFAVVASVCKFTPKWPMQTRESRRQNVDAGLCVSRSSPTEVDVPLGWFGNACVDKE